MFRTGSCLLLLAIVAGSPSFSEELERDVIATASGDLEIFFVGHGTLMMKFDGKVIHVDPFSRLADYAALPDADLVLITHGHRDHLDPGAIAEIRKQGTVVVANAASAGGIEGARALANGETATFVGVTVAAVPAYNIFHGRESGVPFHPKGEGNGYVVTFGEVRVYIAGDTENVPEMAALEGIDVAFLPMNLPYTMTPEMVADAARTIKPRILYPYHYGETDPQRLVDLLRDTTSIDVRVRAMR